MTITRSFAAGSIFTTVATGVLLVGCSVSGHVEKVEPKMSADKLANSVAEQLAATTGQPKPRITCPEDLAAKVGTTTRCKLTTDQGGSLGVSVKVTSAKGSDLKFDIKVDDKVTPPQ